MSNALDAACKPGANAAGLAEQIDRVGGFADGADNPVALHSRKCGPADGHCLPALCECGAASFAAIMSIFLAFAVNWPADM